MRAFVCVCVCVCVYIYIYIYIYIYACILCVLDIDHGQYNNTRNLGSVTVTLTIE
jgi:hypothetical protein